MITNIGKNILAKYLVGQTPSYASHIAVGCGPKPLVSDNTTTMPDYSNKSSLEFEMFRVPIISRGFVDEGGVSKVVLTAELPTQERWRWRHCLHRDQLRCANQRVVHVTRELLLLLRVQFLGEE